MKLERGNLVRITDDEVKIAKLKEEGYEEVEDVEEEATETAKKEEKAEEASEEKADEEVKAIEDKKVTGRGRANNKK